MKKGSKKISFKNYVESSYTDAMHIMQTHFNDAVMFGENVGVILTDMPVLGTTWSYAVNSAGKNNKKQGYKAEIKVDKQGLELPVITFNTFKHGGVAVQWSPREILWNEFVSAKNLTAPRYKPSDYQKKNAELKAKAQKKQELTVQWLIAANLLAAQNAQIIWDLAQPIFNQSEHNYLVLRNIQPHGSRLATQNMILPVIDKATGETFQTQQVTAGDLLIPIYHNGKLVNLQKISPLTGKTKHFLFGGQTKGCSYLIGAQVGSKNALICEGFATGVSVYLATGRPVFVAFSASNMQSVAKMFSESIFAVAADARMSGIEAAEKTGLPIISPPFTPEQLEDKNQGDDWNDYTALVGIEQCSKYINFLLEKTSTQATVTITNSGELHPAASNLADKINCKIGGVLGFDVSIASALVISKMLKGSFWNGSKSKLFILNDENTLVQFGQSGSFGFLQQTFGHVIEKVRLDSEIAKLKADDLSETARKSILKRCNAAISMTVIDYIMLYQQRDAVDWNVDMFATDCAITFSEYYATTNLTHRTIVSSTGLGAYDPAIIADYKEHFPRFDEMLKFVVCSRFAKNRKQSYCWLHASSDWGKSFFKSIFEKMGLVVEMSIKEIEAAYESKPFAKSPRDFIRAFVLVVEEFKTVKSEIKQLENSIAISPKNQPESRVPVYAKLFLSANLVQGLAGENGAEDQFANRFSYIKEIGNLTNRTMFKKVGQTNYHNHVTRYATERVNDEIAQLVDMREESATKQAEDWLSGFIERYGLGKCFGRFSETLPELAEAITDSILEAAQSYEYGTQNKNLLFDSDYAFLKSPNKVISDYLVATYNVQEIGALRPMIPEIVELMSFDGSPAKVLKISGKSVRCIKLKKSNISITPQ